MISGVQVTFLFHFEDLGRKLMTKQDIYTLTRKCIVFKRVPRFLHDDFSRLIYVFT